MEQIDPRKLLVKIARLLEKLKIRYAVTGGMAVFVWGRPRFTADIDIVIQLRSEDVNSLASSLGKVSKAAYIDVAMMRDALTRHGEFNFIDGASGIKVDFWVLKENDFSKSQIKRRIPKTVLGKKVFFVSPEDLILNKFLWHKEGESSKQAEDITTIIKFQKKLDWKYLNKWAEAHSTLNILKNFVRKNE